MNCISEKDVDNNILFFGERRGEDIILDARYSNGIALSEIPNVRCSVTAKNMAANYVPV